MPLLGKNQSQEMEMHNQSASFLVPRQNPNTDQKLFMSSSQDRINYVSSVRQEKRKIEA